jgi:acetyltransferase-like isoleucine patch superfamily enzyme
VGLHPTDQISTSPVFFSTKQQAGMSFVSSNAFEENRKIEIGNDVWVGANAVVLDGVVVGTGAIVAAGAVVTRDVAPYTIVTGIPAQPRRMRFSAERVEILLRSRWWDWSAEKLGKYAPQFADAECFIDQVLRNGDEI